jgi:hypothetical protein|nr:hypothetical protein [Kofleriaceae bacterium]
MLARLAIGSVLALGCGNSSPGADGGGNTLTVALAGSSQGVIASEPPGISCGTCAVGSGCTDTAPQTSCSAEVTPGARVFLALTQQDVDHSVACKSPTDPNVTITVNGLGSCSFTFEASLTIDVTGVAH